MITGRRATDWLAGPPPAPGGEDERRGADRRGADRRAPRRRLDPLFAATLVNQVTPSAEDTPGAYGEAPPRVRRGLIVNIRV